MGKRKMNIGEFIGNMPVVVEHSQKTTIAIFGVEVLSLSVRGPKDADNDGAPEFAVDLNIGGKDIYDGPIELAQETVTQGGAALIGSVLDGVKKLGIKLPF
jgi:hypothetical protein